MVRPLSMLCCFVFIVCSSNLWAALISSKATPVHAISMYDLPKYSADFRHYDYVNPIAPKGGAISTEEIGQFDSFNPFLPRGYSAGYLSMIYDSLLEWSADEPYTAYCLLAESIELPADKSWIAFNLKPEARFNDQHPITADDVIFSYQQLLEHGKPDWKNNFQGVESVSKTSDHRVLFIFKQPDQRKLPFFLGQMTVFPKHFWESDKHDFSKANFDIPLGSGPYQIDSFKPGSQIVFRRSADYWGKDLPINIGRYNFDLFTINYFRDHTVAFEAFKAGSYNTRFENSANKWYTGYNYSAVTRGEVIKELIPVKMNMGMNSFAFNLRRPPMDNPKVREALILTFDFEWINKHQMHDEYSRCNSYFTTHDFAASGLPSTDELKLLEPFRSQLPEKLFTDIYQPPTTDGSGNNRDHLKKAVQLLKEAGWERKGSKMISSKTGKPLELTLISPFPGHERVIMPYIKNLEKIGVKVTVNMLDWSQYIRKIRKFDFDMVQWAYDFERSPGKELDNVFGSEAADQEGSQNIIGIKNPVADQLISMTNSVKSHQELVTILKALDRVLLWNHYVVPRWYMEKGYRIAHRKELKHPNIDNLNWLEMSTWWYQP